MRGARRNERRTWGRPGASVALHEIAYQDTLRYMKRFLTLISVIVLAACVQVQELDLTPIPHATATDPEWIREFDASLIKKETELLASHAGSLDSQVILWEELGCLRSVHVAQLRAAEAIVTRKGISRSDAIAETRSEPGWTIAAQRCHQPYRPIVPG